MQLVQVARKGKQLGRQLTGSKCTTEYVEVARNSIHFCRATCRSCTQLDPCLGGCSLLQLVEVAHSLIHVWVAAHCCKWDKLPTA